jgi:hypothetical protein
MDGHQKIDIELGKLLVNPENYRFDPVTDQREAILTMLRSQNNKIIRLARDIAQRGLNPTRRLQVKEVGGGKYVVLEGNRRITVLKLITNPDEIPGDYLFKSIFVDLHAKYKDNLPTVLECVVYPEDRQDIADSWVLLEHTGENQGMGTVPWNSVQKQRFESRHKQQELSKALQVLEFLEAKGIDTSGIEATNLERLLTTPGVRQELGIDFPNKKLLLIEPEEDVLQKLEKVVERMSARDFGVGQIYKVDQRLEWIKDVLAPKQAVSIPSGDTATSTLAPSNGNAGTPAPKAAPSPSPSNGTSATQSPAANGDSITSTPPQPSPYPSPASPYSYQTLINPTKTLPATAPAKVAEIYKELQIVYITGQRSAPHAVAALLRILLEITAQEYLMRKQGFYHDGSNNFRNPADSGRTYNELRDKLNYITNQSRLPGNIAQVLRALLGQQLMTAELNQVMHSTIFTASSTSIKELWKNFERVFDHLISEIQ